MVVKAKSGGRAMSMPGGLFVGACVSMGSTLLMSAVTAKLVQNGVLAQQSVGYAVMLLLLISSFLGAVTAQGRIKHRRMLVCMLSGGIYYLLLLSITALFFGGQYAGTGVTGLVVLAGCATAALMKARQGRGAGKGRRSRARMHIV